MTQQNPENVEVQARQGQDSPQPHEEAMTPLVDIYETADQTVVLEVELPGAKADSIDLRVDKGVLTVEAKAEPRDHGEDYSVTYRGFELGNYFRAFALSDEVDREKISADYKDGLLTISLPRAAAAQTRKIEIQGG